MITQDQLKDIERRVSELFDYLKIEEKRLQIQEDDLRSQDPTFWDDPKAAELLMKKLRVKKGWVESYEKALSNLEDLKVLLEFHEMGETTAEEIEAHVGETMIFLEELEFKNMLSAEEDNFNAIIHKGININRGKGCMSFCIGIKWRNSN